MEGKVLITALYAGILGVIMVLLSLRVIVVARARAPSHTVTVVRMS